MEYKEKYKPIKFPEDEQKHNHIIEWWYFNGNLKTKDKKTFSYMNCLFSADPKNVNIPFLNKSIDNLFFSHSLLSNNKDRFESETNPMCLVSEESFTKPLLWIMYDNNCLIKEISPFKYNITNNFVDLILESEKKPLLLNKNGFLDLDVKTTYYYSLTRLKTTGFVKDKNKWLNVEGVSWMDHQWAQTPLTDDDKWIWFSIQLNNGCDIVCFSYGDKVKTLHASMIDKNNRTKTTSKVEIIPQEEIYTNKKTGSSYHLKYLIKIPSFDLEIKTSPLKEDQEMVFGIIKYWEGGIEIKGKMDGKNVTGMGFSELVTSPRDKIIKSLLGKMKTPMKNIRNVADIGAKSIYIINKNIQKKRK